MELTRERPFFGARNGEPSQRAEYLYALGQKEQPLRAAIFTVEQLEIHARALAGSHVVRRGRGTGMLLRRLGENQQIIAQAYRMISKADAAGRRLAPAAEWLLDNHYLIQEQIRLARQHLPKGFARQLPVVQDGEMAGYPRVYDLALRLIAHLDGKVDAETLTRFVAAYQSVSHLTLGELWAVPIMLRLALIENLRRVSVSMTWRRVHRDMALDWASQINDASEKREGQEVLLLAEMLKSAPPLSTAFVAEFTQTLQGRGPAVVFILAWLEQRLAEQGQTIDQMIAAESQSQAADQVSVANAIASLRFVGAQDWHEFVEGQSFTEAILRADPMRTYPRMDFATRDMYRHAVEEFARRRNISEERVAKEAMDLATTGAPSAGEIARHVGFWLIDEGRGHLSKVLKSKRDQAPVRSEKPWIGYRLAGYLLAVAIIAASMTWGLYLLIPGAGLASKVLVVALGALAISQPAIAFVNWVGSVLFTPDSLPRMDFAAGIPDEHRTIVAIPTMLTSTDRIPKLIEDIELRYLGNRDANVWFALLTDFADADSHTMPLDQELLALTEQGIRDLNAKYGDNGHGRFFLLHRPRQFNEKEGVWMARERKRGKLEDFGAILRGRGRDRFSTIVGDAAELTTIENVIVLDTDTALPWGSAGKLVATLAHPLNHPVIDDKPQVQRGYVVLQPRVNIALTSAQASRYSRLMAGEVGIDPYTRVVSDVYQDLFTHASFIGKGIYHVDGFRRLLEGRFPSNRILSHDLLESLYARTGLVSDVELLEEHPSRYLADANRRHRWVRGDWQIAPYLAATVTDAQGETRASGVGALGRWKIFDNLRRSVVPPALLLTFVLGWVLTRRPELWSLWVVGAWVLPDIVPFFNDVIRGSPDMPRHIQLIAALESTRDSLLRLALVMVFLPHEAVMNLDAIARTVWRLAVSRRRLLQWQTAAAAERAAHRELTGVGMQMSAAVGIALLATALVAMSSASLAAASPILAVWLVSPGIAWWVSQPVRQRARALGAAQVDFLRRTARLTWRFFEDFVAQEDNWLPPDNFQEYPSPRIAHRTSPTNIGLSLLSNLSAWDFGYITTSQLLSRTGETLKSMEVLERYRGHFYNWYDTRTRKAINPLYISTVDSGNLVGHLCVLRQGLLDLPDKPILPDARGLRDTLSVLELQLNPRTADGEAQRPKPAYDQRQFQLLEQLLARYPRGLRAQGAWVVDVCRATVFLAGSIKAEAAPEASWWAEALDRQVQSFRGELAEIAPWALIPPSSDASHAREILAELDEALSLGDLAQKAKKHSSAAASQNGSELHTQLIQCQEQVAQRLHRADGLAQKCWEMAQADFQFLFDKPRKLMVIGYNVAERRADNSHYDLLASEARLASYANIAMGQLPIEHWFALSRLLTRAHGKPGLVSWSGSMFEYLMPLLVMPTYPQTLLDETYRAVVDRQINYGERLNIPWGVSESCYSVTDADGNYQYRAFGVPGLGLQRGLSNDIVIAPYASMMALMVNPTEACRNLRRLANEDYLARYGFYEAIDFTPSRLPENTNQIIIRSYMAHHQGMSLVSLGEVLERWPMHERFRQVQAFRAAELLLQERVPRTAGDVFPHSDETVVSRQAGAAGPEAETRVVSDPATPTPETHLLSNGRYHVMVTAAGGGYSRWNDIAINRWREDPTCDGWGIFCYVGEGNGDRFWSNSYHPTLTTGRNYHAVFTQGRAEFRRQDHRVETHTEIAVSPEDDLEIRRITLTNRSGIKRALSLTSFFEAVGSHKAPDDLHRVFSNLFVQTELDPQRNAVMVTRRPRSADEKPTWMFCMMISATEGVQPCSFETDRAKFLGRGRTPRRPVAMESGEDLTNSSGPVLDPCVAIRRRFDLPEDATARFDLIIGSAPTREGAMAMVNKYQDYRMADRVFELASAHSRVVLGHLGGTEALAQQFGHLASAVIYASETHRAAPSVLRQNRKGQSGLWSSGISGDLPIVLLRVADTENLRMVRDMLMAHAYWRMKGLNTDLLIWNEDASGYRQKLNDQIMAMIAVGTEAHLIDKPGGIFVRAVEHIAEEDRILMQTCARVVLNASEGSLDEQLERRKRLMASTPPAAIIVARSTGAKMDARPLPPRQDLSFSNGQGGFTRDGREYVVNIAPDSMTPAPWSNVIANPRMGTVVTESGGAYTWFDNAQLFRLTPWYNDTVSDRSGEAIYLRDDRTGRYFSATPLPHAGNGRYISRHGFGYSIFEHREEGIETQLTQYVDLKAPVKISTLKLKNTSAEGREISVFAYAELVLGDLQHKNAMYVVTELDPRTGAILARNNYGPDFGNCVTFLDCSQTLRSVTGDRKEFLGRNGDMCSPAAMKLRRLSGRVGPGLDPCAGIQTKVELGPGEEREVVIVMGAGADREEALSLIQRFRGSGPARVALEEVWRFWNERLGILYVETPDTALNVMANGWLPYQTLACRMWGRSGYYQSGGAYGFRDQLQDCLALLHEAPELCREHLLRCASRQFPEGDVQHWWHPPSGRGVRTTCSDDYLWLPYAVCRYVAFTHDMGVLDEKTNFIAARPLREGEESVYDLPTRLEESATIYEHCVRAIKHGLKFGSHGIPLMGSGDWNDGMNLVGHGGKGESVWLAFFLHHVLRLFSQLARQRGDDPFAGECDATCKELAQNIDAHCWDGNWYRRAYFDSGEPLGSAQNPECQIDLLPQSWAVIADVGDLSRRKHALEAMWEHLVQKNMDLIELLAPPFDQSNLEPGYIKGYVPGVRENGGQYTHAAVWATMAFAMAGEIDRAWDMVRMINPINHGSSREKVERYKIEPYALAGDVYSSARYPGRGGWSWYTGSAGWFYRLIHEVLLGIDRRGDEMTFEPKVPDGWTNFKMHYRYYQTFYHITFTRDASVTGRARVTLDRQAQENGVLRLINDQREHAVEIRFGSVRDVKSSPPPSPAAPNEAEKVMAK
jgi:cellobiose phosphorylase